MARKIYRVLAYFMVILLMGNRILMANDKLGLGVITNTRTRASETFKIFEIFQSLNFKNGSHDKMKVIYSENAPSSGLYITGELEHYKLSNLETKNHLGRMLTIDEEKNSRNDFWANYITKIKLQIWKDQKFVYLFTDSVLYFPTNDNLNTLQNRIIEFEGFYDESFELISPLMLNLFTCLDKQFNVQVSGLKNGKIFKFDVKAHVTGTPFQLNKFLSPYRKELVNGSYRSGSFNDFFENKFTTISSKELFFVDKYGNSEMYSIVSNIAYPKTCWKEAVMAYIDLGDNFLKDQDFEAFALANWTALILSNQLKEKISDIFVLKKTALQNLSKFAQMTNEPNFKDLLELNIALIEGLLHSTILKESEQKYDRLMQELEKTFSSSQDAMYDLRRQERSNRFLNTLSLAVTLTSAANDGTKGLQSMSSTTETLMNNSLELSKNLEDRLNASENYFQAHFADINFNIPPTFLQPEADDRIDYNKAILYLECMKLIYADVNNNYWVRCFESFISNHKEMSGIFENAKAATGNLRTSALVNLSKGLSKFERNAFITEKLQHNEKN